MIQLFKPVFDVETALAGIRECLESGWTGMGNKTLDFEEAWKAYTGLPHAHFLNSATSGLHLALELAKSRRQYHYGTEKVYTQVISTPLTFVSTNHTIKHAGLTPVLADVDSSLCLDPASVEDILEQDVTKCQILAVVYVAMGGNYANLAEITDLCTRYRKVLIVDAAHAAGTHINERHIGHEADYTVFSFHSVKNLPTADAGMLCCHSAYDDKLARQLSWLGISKDTWSRNGNWEYSVPYVGWKYHGNSIMASIALAQLPLLDEHNARRREVADMYDTYLRPTYERIRHLPGSSRHLYQVLVPADYRQDVIDYASANGVQLGVHYRSNTTYPMYPAVCPYADSVSSQLLSLPIGPHLSDTDVSKVVQVLREAL